ncbi:MAG: alkaline phosphatase family protein [Nitrospirota bacterium]
MKKGKKVLIIGLDCAAPELIFERWSDDMPALRKLMENGIYGRLKSTIPPITCPAWTSMMTSKDPGTLGVYGFRNRGNYSYDNLKFVNSRMVVDDTLWDILLREGKQSIVVGVPQTYPPKPINGNMITCFLTPGPNSQYTYPLSLKGEIENLVGEYSFDVASFRTDDKDFLIRQIYEMTEKRFKVHKWLMKDKEWDFFIFVEMGIDRIHHGLWKYFDKGHRKYSPGSKYENAIRDYYIYMDRKINELLSIVDEDTVVMVVSDHGAQKMDGGICINEWLIREGYLKLKEKPDGIIPFSKAKVDWGNTCAWSEGGYYARVFLNVKGREPNGVIEKGDYDKVRDELKERIEGIVDENGINIDTKVYKPEEIYSKTNRISPDLIVHFGDLSWRSIGSIGHNSIHLFENDTGPDDANHAQHGIFIINNMGNRNDGAVSDKNILDIAPTVLDILDISIPEDMQGRVIRT